MAVTPEGVVGGHDHLCARSVEVRVGSSIRCPSDVGADRFARLPQWECKAVELTASVVHKLTAVTLVKLTKNSLQGIQFALQWIVAGVSVY